MLANAAMNPLRVAKQRISSYTSQLSGYSDYSLENGDYEKGRRRSGSYSDSEASSPRSSSEISSRSTSQSFEPMLSPNKRPKSRRKSSSYATSYPNIPTRLTCGTLPPRWSGRLFSLGLLAVVILFITTLTRSHWRSIADVESGKHRPPPPPPAWEKFPFLKRYHGGVRNLVPKSENVPEYPGEEKPKVEEKKEDVKTEEKVAKREDEKKVTTPSITFDPYIAKSREIVTCYLDEKETVTMPKLQVFPGVPSGMPEPIYGSFSLMGMRDDICYERYGRLGPYGLGYSKRMGGSGISMDGDREGIEAVWANDDYVNYKDFKWAQATNRCEIANAHRFEPVPTHSTNFFQKMPIGGPDDEAIPAKDRPKMGYMPKMSPPSNLTTPRTAVIIRTWTGYQYDPEDIFYLRSLIAELSLASGGEYSVHFLIHVKDNNAQI